MEYDGHTVVAENNVVIGSIQHLNLLYILANEKAERIGFSFRSDDYRWKLGIRILCDLQMSPHLSYMDKVDEVKTLFGIPIEIDHVNPTTVQLWHNITNEV